ncbi:hypothetical protein E5161_03650 [Cohnella pontilimi]|uniref:Uncharacterized protein n=1 Tax=Cohnella pontilimi TaxID=2564100 RepID=A0A4U0FHM7_9BACL|nr:hypothetical protein [Cohnella pontilimi]TJY44485.1 hypothetical protein E5161_03650 [Cohnella pontilimi]
MESRDADLDTIAKWNAELQQCRLDLELKRKWESRQSKLSTDIKRQRRLAEECLQILQKEEQDVEHLNNSSFSQFWLRLFDQLDDRLREEEREAAEAKLKYDAAQAALRGMEEELADVTRKLAEIGDAESRLQQLMGQKESWIRDHDAAAKEELERLSEQLASNKARQTEVQEAYRAGQTAQQCLSRADERLNSAKNWGTYDMLGGGMIATMVKHGRIDEAQDHIHEAQHYLRRFAEELKDLNWEAHTSGPEVGGFLKFSDYFFDGFIADWMVQGKIRDSIDSVGTTSNQVDAILRKLDAERRKLEQDSVHYRNQYDELIQRYGS